VTLKGDMKILHVITINLSPSFAHFLHPLSFNPLYAFSPQTERMEHISDNDLLNIFKRVATYNVGRFFSS
jgi:hypothetical protein